MPHLALLATGGTIASVRYGAGRRATAGGADLLARTTVPPGCTVAVTDTDIDIDIDIDIDTVGSRAMAMQRRRRSVTVSTRGLRVGAGECIQAAGAAGLTAARGVRGRP